MSGERKSFVCIAVGSVLVIVLTIILAHYHHDSDGAYEAQWRQALLNLLRAQTAYIRALAAHVR